MKISENYVIFLEMQKHFQINIDHLDIFTIFYTHFFRGKDNL